jgi:hypothetical protein
MSKLPWWLNLSVKILFVDLTITLFVMGWSWIKKDFGMVSLSNRFFSKWADCIHDQFRIGYREPGKPFRLAADVRTLCRACKPERAESTDDS